MNKYRESALTDVLTFHASFMTGNYETEGELEEAICNGEYDPQIHRELADNESEVVATLRLEEGEAKVLFCEDSTWVVWFQDILNRWYDENKEYFEAEIDCLMGIESRAI